jgi:serine/threonine-protein kinase
LEGLRGLWYDPPLAGRNSEEENTTARARRGFRRLASAAFKFVLIAIAFVAVLVASGYFTMRLALLGREVAVPDVTGMALSEAQESLSRKELFIETSAERHDDRVEKGRILAQDPPAGAEIKKFRKVKVVTSLGPRTLKVPDLRGLSLRAAQVKLQGEGLRAADVAYAHTLLGDADIVASQDPLPTGESVGEGGVSLLVSRGAREAVYVMPDLAGRQVEEARAVLEAHGVRVGSIRRERRGTQPRGTISRQYPEAGWPIAQGDVVSLVVSD